jgi:hypothetical protein
MLKSGNKCFFVSYIFVHRASHWSTAVFAKNQGATSVITETLRTPKMLREGGRVEWLVDWSGASGSEMSGRVPLLGESTDELSDQGVLLSGFYIFDLF